MKSKENLVYDKHGAEGLVDLNEQPHDLENGGNDLHLPIATHVSSDGSRSCY